MRSSSGVDEEDHSRQRAAALIMSAPRVAQDDSRPSAVTRPHAVSDSQEKGLVCCPPDSSDCPLLLRAEPAFHDDVAACSTPRAISEAGTPPFIPLLPPSPAVPYRVDHPQAEQGL